MHDRFATTPVHIPAHMLGCLKHQCQQPHKRHSITSIPKRAASRQKSPIGSPPPVPLHQVLLHSQVAV
jgi:hypothetical protein